MSVVNNCKTLLEENQLQNLPKLFEKMSACYHKRGRSTSLSFEEKLIYCASRMLATYAVNHHVLSQLPSSCQTFLDLGCGPGTASLAAFNYFTHLEKAYLVDHDQEMLQLAHYFLKDYPIVIQHQSLKYPLSFQADVVVLSYVLGEIPYKESLLEQAWQATSQFLVLLYPGTPHDFQDFLLSRQFLLQKGGFLVGPCPHHLPCPVEWCHFSVRLERNRLLKVLKRAELGFEDEKYNYLIISKTPQKRSSKRLIHTPLLRKNHVILDYCSAEGTIEKTVIPKSKKELYQQAKKSSWGDEWE